MHEDLFLATNRLIFFMLLAFGLSAIAARGLAGIATHVGLMDMPGGRKQHDAPVPVIGGIAMFFGFAAAALGSGLVVGPTLALIAALASWWSAASRTTCTTSRRAANSSSSSSPRYS